MVFEIFIKITVFRKNKFIAGHQLLKIINEITFIQFYIHTLE
jgi:hypothetical protein